MPGGMGNAAPTHRTFREVAMWIELFTVATVYLVLAASVVEDYERLHSADPHGTLH